MAKHLILKTQKNVVLEAILQNGLDPSEFQWIECNSTNTAGLQVSELIHKNTRYYFIFDFLEDRHWTEYSPGPDSQVHRQYPGNWDQLYRHVLQWLNSLRQEIEAPDLWDVISQESKLAEAASASGIPKTPFTSEEQEDISARLDKIEKHLITTQNVSKEHTELVRERFDYLKETIRHQGRLNWLQTLIGVLFTIAGGIGLSQSELRELFQFVDDNLRQFLSKLLSLAQSL